MWYQAGTWPLGTFVVQVSCNQYQPQWIALRAQANENRLPDQPSATLLLRVACEYVDTSSCVCPASFEWHTSLAVDKTGVE